MAPAHCLDYRNWLEHAHQLLDERRISEALDAYNMAQKSGCPPNECAGGRWMCWMLTGEFESAWRESDKLETIQPNDPNRFWDGSPFHGKRVLLRALHGYGDAVQFIRYARNLRCKASKLIVQTHPELMPLMRTIVGIDEVITWPDPPPDECCWDQQIEIMELPRAFRTTLESIPREVPYISLESSLIERSRHRLAKTSKLKLGLVWASSRYDTSRTISLETLSPILRIDHIEFYSFQRGLERAELKRVNGCINDTAIHSREILESAADLANMDLVISVDTFAAHLAAALNRPVWLMLPYAADWRWMLNRCDSPWYPSMRLFRQPAHGEWTPVINNVITELISFVQSAKAI